MGVQGCNRSFAVKHDIIFVLLLREVQQSSGGVGGGVGPWPGHYSCVYLDSYPIPSIPKG